VRTVCEYYPCRTVDKRLHAPWSHLLVTNVSSSAIGTDLHYTPPTRNNLTSSTGRQAGGRGGQGVWGPARGPPSGARPRPPQHAHDPQQPGLLARSCTRRLIIASAKGSLTGQGSSVTLYGQNLMAHLHPRGAQEG